MPKRGVLCLLIKSRFSFCSGFWKQPTTIRIVIIVLIDISLLLNFIKSRYIKKLLAISLGKNPNLSTLYVCIYRKTNTIQIIPDHQNEPTNNINNQRYNPSLINHREIIIIAILVNFTFAVGFFVAFFGYASEIATVFLPIIVAISIPSMLFYFNGKLRQFYLRQFWENAPNFLQCFNPNRIIEINNADNDIELGSLSKNKSHKKRF